MLYDHADLQAILLQQIMFFSRMNAAKRRENFSALHFLNSLARHHIDTFHKNYHSFLPSFNASLSPEIVIILGATTWIWFVCCWSCLANQWPVITSIKAQTKDSPDWKAETHVGTTNCFKSNQFYRESWFTHRLHEILSSLVSPLREVC